MAYLKKEDRILLERMNKELKIPKGWYYFVKKQQKKHNLIIKQKGICKCNNCKKEFISDKKINEYEKCPKCKNIYKIKSNRYSGQIFESDLVLVQKLDNNKIVVRLFEIFSKYTKKETTHSSATEYGRILLIENEDEIEERQYVNDRLVSGMYGNYTVYHTNEGKKWRKYDTSYRRLDVYGKIYYNNLKETFFNTKYQYSELWNLAKHEEGINLIYLIKNYRPSIEFLTKLKLYKLALCPKTFDNKGSFENRFGVEKRFLKFMVDNNIDVDELKILKIYKKEDINKIRYLKNFSASSLEEISEFVSLDKFVEYTKMNKFFDIRLYIDYLKFVQDLGMDLKNKKYLFPENLREKHDELEHQIKIKNNKIIQSKIRKRFNELKKNKYEGKKYIIFPANSISSLEDESKQQNNCVRTYTKRYANGECDIYFMRTIDEPTKSLVTVEVKDDKIVQSRTKNNNKTNQSQNRFLDRWEKQIIQKVA